MATFRKDDQSGRNRPRTTKRAGSEDKDKKKDGYKAKRSFSKNKSFRSEKEATGGEKKKSFRDKPFGKEERRSEDGRPPRRSFSSDERPRKPFSSDERPSRGSRDEGSRERFERPSGSERPARKSFGSEERASRGNREGGSRERFERPSGSERPARKSFGYEERPSRGNREGSSRERFERTSGSDRPNRKSFGSDDRPSRNRGRGAEREGAPERRVKYEEFEEGRAFKKQEATGKERKSKPKEDGLIRLNKYLANAGISSRREADTLIQSGVVKVNGEVVDQLGYKVKPGDKVTYGDSAVKSERKVYLLLNKPKDYISTVDDPRERKTVMDLIAGACKERIYPVGRLDRNTTGLLLMTNDGELTTKLTHPKFGVKKVYHVTLDKGLRADDFRKIIEGFDLEDGPVKVDDLAFVGEGKKEVGVEIHSGRNRIVRRLFEHLGYDVIKLDRVVFAGLTKKDLPRGKHRFLTAREISFLQMIG